MEEKGLLPVGVAANGNPVSNADIYLYKMAQANLLYSPNEPVTVKEADNTVRKVKMTEVMNGNHREVLKDLTSKDMSDAELAEASRCVKSVERTISSSGHANLDVQGVTGKYSYNQQKNAGFEEAAVTVPTPVTANSNQAGTAPNAPAPNAPTPNAPATPETEASSPDASVASAAKPNASGTLALHAQTPRDDIPVSRGSELVA